MAELKFKTNINCGNCIRSVSPFLNREPDIEVWHVDLSHPDRILTVEGDIAPSAIVGLVVEAGFECEPV